ncbi:MULTISPECIES: hypothetical protein [unclassified Bartonella]|uniref:hypothetical protein n=1 Tax=unclassified Bartonella TaxID=2645622 RepID=UPI0035D04DB2
MKDVSSKEIDIIVFSYPDFWGFLDINNTSPSGLETIKYWITHGAISKKSYLLDLVCSTVFSALNIVCEVQCQAVGIYISAESIGIRSEQG